MFPNQLTFWTWLYLSFCFYIYVVYYILLFYKFNNWNNFLCLRLFISVLVIKKRHSKAKLDVKAIR